MKIVYNACFGGFGLSYKAVMRYAEIKGIKLYAFGRGASYDSPPVPISEEQANKELIHYATTPEYSNETHWSDYDLDRTDPALVQVVEELGSAAGGSFADLQITNLPPGTRYRIDEYDGNERVMTQDSYDWKVAT